jgi:hypothetical protein
MGPGPDRRTMPGSGLSAALTGDVRRARACRPDRAGREGADGWAAAQCRVAVPLTGGAGLSAGAVESARQKRGRAWAGPRRKRGDRAQMNSKVLHLFELV